jgi:23S rRNA (cytidine1920-2'-O)/16S rRNA (cytidine1409-2'-O)-methyltransferase
MAGRVTVDGAVVTKAGAPTAEVAELAVVEPPRYVSRGGEKLENGLKTFGIDVTGELCLDVGASTGGFTDCLLAHGAARVIAVDVGRNQLHERIAGDPRVTVIDRYNARNLKVEDLPFRPTFVTVDVSFISLRLVLPALFEVAADAWRGVVLVKPQFEAGREQVRKGVVRDPEVHRQVLRDVCGFVTRLGVDVLGVCDSCVRGPAGNREYLVALRAPRPANFEEPTTDVESHITNAVFGPPGGAGAPGEPVHPRPT